MRLLVHELQLVIWNGNPESVQTAGLWKKIDSQRK
jgi:hypothetical protein